MSASEQAKYFAADLVIVALASDTHPLQLLRQLDPPPDFHDEVHEALYTMRARLKWQIETPKTQVEIVNESGHQERQQGAKR